MLPLIIGGLVPVVLNLINKLVPSNTDAAQKHEWVQGFFIEVGNALAGVIPSWLKPEMAAIESILTAAVQAELDKILPKN